jgi:hypothetical protein
MHHINRMATAAQAVLEAFGEWGIIFYGKDAQEPWAWKGG